MLQATSVHLSKHLKCNACECQSQVQSSKMTMDVILSVWMVESVSGLVWETSGRLLRNFLITAAFSPTCDCSHPGITLPEGRNDSLEDQPNCQQFDQITAGLLSLLTGNPEDRMEVYI